MILFYNAVPEYPFRRHTVGASGFDLHAIDDLSIPPGRWARVGTGIHISVPRGVEAQVRARSGISFERGLVADLGTIDSDYRGEIMVTLYNRDWRKQEVERGTRVAQLVFVQLYGVVSGVYGSQVPYEAVNHVDDLSLLGVTERGAGGHGSTGQ